MPDNIPGTPSRPAIDATKVVPSRLYDNSKPIADKYQRPMAEFSALKSRLKPISIIQKAMDITRKIDLAPSNVRNYLNKRMGLPTGLSNNSLTHLQRATMYKTVEAAIKRTGKDYGTTQYEDYQTTPNVKEQIISAKNGNINPLIGAWLGNFDPAYDMATTTGRGTYAKNPLTGEIAYTDTYDFNNNYTQGKDGKVRPNYMQGRTDFYGTERKRLAEQDTNQSPDNNSIGFMLNPTDTIGYQSFLDKRGDISPISTPSSLYQKYQNYKKEK